jgi:hypothetical protein
MILITYNIIKILLLKFSVKIHLEIPVRLIYGNIGILCAMAAPKIGRAIATNQFSVYLLLLLEFFGTDLDTSLVQTQQRIRSLCIFCI